MFELIAGKSPYHSPTDMGVNMAGNCIIDDEVCQEASRKEIIRRYFKCLCDQKTGGIVKDDRYKLELLLNQAASASACAPWNSRPTPVPIKPAAAPLRQSNCRMALL